MRFVTGNPQWSLAQFNFDSDVVLAEDKAGMMNALDTNLKPFFDRGGKIISYHGWNDPQISPLNFTLYYDRVVSAMGGRDRVAGSYRLFMVPGMAHCGGGTGTATFDMLTALEQWVEGKKAPERHAPKAERLSAHVRCARTRRSRATRGQEARTRQRTSFVSKNYRSRFRVLTSRFVFMFGARFRGSGFRFVSCPALRSGWIRTSHDEQRTLN